MDDRDFFDHLHQLWSKTTGAEDRYWMPEENAQFDFDIFAVAQEDERYRIASDLSDEDADFISAVHGCLPDLVRRLHAALDEADRADYDRDERECRMAELELENQQLQQEVEHLRDQERRSR